MANKRNSMGYMVVPVALLALLVLSLTLGSLWHHHAGSSEATCPICHLSHQSAEPHQASDRVPPMALLVFSLEPRSLAFVPAPISEREPARAPPAA